MDPAVTLDFSINSQVIFQSSGKWLHPLFELEQFLRLRGINASGGEIRDKVVGRGSAFLIVRLGIRTVHAGILSRLGKDVLDRAGAACTCDTLVEEIQCQTEGILRDVEDVEEAFRILSERAGNARKTR